MRIRLFFSALALTLLLLLPMVGLVEYFAMQRQMQERVRRANAAGTAVQVDPASRYMGSLLLAVQKEEPEFILLRMDAPAATLTLCGLPGNMQLAAPSGTTTLAAAYLAAGPARAAQLLGDTLGTAPQHYLAATPSCYASFWEQGTTVRLDMAALQENTDPHQNFGQKSRLPLPKPLCVIWGQSRLMPEQPGCWQLTPRPYSAKPPSSLPPCQARHGRPVPAF